MSQQPNLNRVFFKCWACRRQHGPTPLLAVAEWADGQWWVYINRRHGRGMRELQATSRGGVGEPRDKPVPINPTWRPDSRSVLMPFRGLKGTRLACTRCTARPGVARAALVALAEETAAAGRHEAYL
jgi:hypothetical protein